MVCVSVWGTCLSCAKTGEPVQMQFGRSKEASITGGSRSGESIRCHEGW